MANSPRKPKDPTELALSAIEDALNVHDTPREPVARRAPVNDRVEAPRRGRAPQVETDDTTRSTNRPIESETRDEVAAPARLAANDDRESVGQLLRALQRRPSRAPYLVAWLFTACWGLAFAGIALGVYGSELSQILGQGKTSIPVIAGLTAGLLAPIALFFFLAAMLSRAQELRLVGQSMAQIAVRLAEPETIARDSVVSVGQAVRREVAAIGDGVERALARAGELEGMVNNEVASLERAYADNEVRMRGLIDGIVAQRETLVDHAEQVRAAISNVHVDLSHEIGAVSDMVAEQVNEAAQRITDALAEKGDHIARALQSSGDNMISAVGDRGGDLLERLEQASEITTRAIDAASERMTTNLTFKTSNIHGEFAEIADNIRHMMASKLDNVADEFSQKAISVIDNMQERSSAINETLMQTSTSLSENLLQTSTSVAESLAARVDEVNNTLKATGDSLVLDLTLRGGDVVSKLEQTGASITDAINTGGARVTESFQSHAEALTASVSTHGDSMRDLLAQRLAAFEEMFSNGGTELAERISRDSSTLGELISRHLTEFDRTVKTYGGELVERIGLRTHEINETMRDYIDGFDGRVTAKASDVSTLLDERLTRFQEALDSRTQSLNDALSSRVMEIAKGVAEGGSQVITAIDERLGNINGAISEHTDRMTAEIASKVQEIDRALGEQANIAAANFDQRIASFGQQANRAASDFDQRIASFGQQADVAAQNFDQRLARFEQQTGVAATTFDQRIARFEDILLSRAEAVVSDIEARGLATAGRFTAVIQDINSNTHQAEQSISALAGGAASEMRNAASEMERSIRAASSQAEQSLAAMSSGTSSTLKQTSAEVERSLLGVSSQITRMLDEKSGVLVSAIGVKSSELTNELARITDQAANAIEAKGLTYARSLRDNSQDIAQKINDASEHAAVNIGKAMRDLEASAASSVESSRKTASQAVAEILETNGMLRSDTTALFERLREANGLLQEVLSGAHSNLTSIESVLSTRVTEFVGAMNTLLERTGNTTTRMDDHIGGFYEVTGKVLENLTDLSSRFNQHGRDLAEATALVETSNKRTENLIGDRRTALESMVETLDTRTGEIDSRLKMFNGLLDEALASAENRARDIARTIADSTAVGTRAIADQYQTVRDTAEEERRRTLDSLRQIYEHATGDAQAMFQGATERFTEIVQSMKHMSGEMQRELDNTRHELRRGILELPQETAESAAQMRRVIVDQIEALAELNRIVARHGREVDLAEPVAARRAPAREEAVAAGGNNSRTENPRAPFVGNAPPMAPSVRRQEPAAYAPPPAPTPQPQNSAPNGQANWLSDLLSRASRDEAPATRGNARGEERPTRHTIESLDSLSVDIARMIDHDAAAELWERYNRGERNVFTRKLYTMQGQKAFDEVRRRYRADREFKQTVDRYIGEFERLLDEVSRDDRGQVVVRTYLTSETGKVYTMLAHAAGRIE
jgi:hypothetical protein